MKRVLIAGVGGFLGVNLAHYLLKSEDIELYGIDNLSNEQMTLLYPLLKNERFNFIEDDLINGINNNFDEVYFFAGSGDLTKYFENKYEYTFKQLKIIELMLNYSKVTNAKILFASSYENHIYGTKIKLFNHFIKLADDLICEYSTKNKLNLKIVKISDGYGLNFIKDDKRFINRTIYNAISNTDIELDYNCEKYFTFSEDIIKALKLIMESDIENNIIEVSNENKYSLLDVAKLIKNFTNSNSKIILKTQDFKNINYLPNVDYLSNKLNFKCNTNIIDGLKATIEFIKKMYFS